MQVAKKPVKLESNLLVLDINEKLPLNLKYLHKALEESQFALAVELEGLPSVQSYDAIISILSIFYSYINKVKKHNPFFEGVVLLPTLLQYPSLATNSQFDAIFSKKNGNLECLDEKGNLVQCESLSAEIDLFLSGSMKEVLDVIQGIKEGRNGATKIGCFNRIAFGGTFDHIHIGHKIMLSSALLLSSGAELIVLGLTGDELLKNKSKKELLQAFSARKAGIESFQAKFNPKNRFFIFELSEPMGPLRDQDFDAVVGSFETLPSLRKINEFRKSQERSEFNLVLVDVVGSSSSSENTDFSEKTSSSLIREYLLSKNDLTYEQFKELTEDWKRLFSVYASAGDSVLHYLNSWFDRIKIHYSESQRFYHTLHHIYSLLKLSQTIDVVKNRREVELAIWFHDVIYNPLRGDNEERSALLYLEFNEGLVKLTGEAFGRSSVVAEFIRCTASHTEKKSSEEISSDESLNRDLDLFIDMDLSILGESESEYEKYRQGILAEYSHFSKQEIQVGRSKVLSKFLDAANSESLFRTKIFADKFLNAAKVNLENELKVLQS